MKKSSKLVFKSLKNIILIVFFISILVPIFLTFYLIILYRLDINIEDYNYYIKLPNDYRYECVSSGNCKVSLKRYSNEAFLPEQIVELAWNDRYVVAKQYEMKLKYSENSDNTYEIPDKTKVYYWILDTVERKRYGPYSDEKQLEVMKNKFNIDNLQLKSVDSYKKTKEKVTFKSNNFGEKFVFLRF